MNIIVCTKAVPGFIKHPQVSESQDRIDYEAGSIIINESDDYALEAGIKIAKKTGGSATVITAGALSSQKVLQTGLGKGADRAVRIDSNLADPSKIARVLSEAIRQENFDLILTGVESRDNMAAQVGVFVAEMLGVPFAYAVLDVAPGESDQTVLITKELGFGKTQIEEITLPALVCFQTGNKPPGFVPVRKMIMAQRKPIKSIAANNLMADETPASLIIKGISPPDEASLAEIIQGSTEEQATIVLQKIREVL